MTKEEIKIWFARINECEQFHAKYDEERKQILKLYSGQFFNKPTDNSGETTEVNFLYEFCEVMVSSVYARDPHLFCRARSKNYWKFAETMEFALNYYWEELKMKKKMKRNILYSVLNPPGAIELGYLFIKESREDNFTRQLENEFPELSKVTPQTEKIGIFDDTIKTDDIFANVLSGWEYLWPDGYHEIRECPYLIKRWKVSLLDLYSNTMLKSSRYEINGAASKADVNKIKKFHFKENINPINMVPSGMGDLELIKVTLYGVFDKRSQRRFILAENYQDDTLFERDWKYLSEGFPIFPLIFNEIPPSKEEANSMPMSDAIPMLPQLKELSKISSAMMRHRKRAGTLIAIRKGRLSESDKTAMMESSDLDIVEFDNIDADSFQGFTPPSLSQDFYSLREVILEDLMRISGFQQLLSKTGGVETAEESRNIREGSLIRQSGRVDLIEQYTIEVAQYMAGLLWQFKTKEEISEILGEPVDEEMWPEIPENMDKARKILQKQIYFKIEAGSTRPPQDEAIERKLWMDLMGTIKANFPGRLNDSIILPQLLKKFDFKDVEQAVIGFDEEERQVAIQENALLEKGIPIPVSPNQNHKIHLEVHSQGPDSPAKDQHLMGHSNYEQQLNPTIAPQRGDVRAAPLTTTPEIKRKGVPQSSDLKSMVPLPGGNKGGP